FPVRVGQREVVKEMLENLSGDRYAEFSQVGEIALRLMARQVRLGKENFLREPLERSPDFDLPLKGAQLPFLEALRMLSAQMVKDRLGLDRGVAIEQLLHFRPNFGEGVRPSAIAARFLGFTRRLSALAPFASGLRIHSGLGRGNRQGLSRL